MTDPECIAFLQWALPRLHLRWPGFRKVRRTVAKRLARRLTALDLPDLDAYRARLDAHPDEWTVLDAMCRIPISRFCRDRGVWTFLASTLLPDLADAAEADGRESLRAWSAGCASGEEVYSLRLAWDLGPAATRAPLRLRILGTDIDDAMLARARRACYAMSSLKDVPPEWLDAAFDHRDDEFCVRAPFRHDIELHRQDIRAQQPHGPFDLVLCRHLAFTYFDEDLQRDVLRRLLDRLAPHGVLVAGKQESLPCDATALLVECAPHTGVYRLVS